MRKLIVCSTAVVLLFAIAVVPVIEVQACDTPEFKKCKKRAEKERDKCKQRAYQDYVNCLKGRWWMDPVCRPAYEAKKAFCWGAYYIDLDNCYDDHCDET